MLKGEKLGEGTFGIVYTGTSPESGRHYAIKRNLKEGMSFMGASRELDILNRLRDHPHVVRLEKIAFGAPFQNGCFSPLIGEDHKTQVDDNVHFVFGKASYDLHTFVHGASVINFNLIKRYMVHILLGIEYVHAKKIIHRDLKPSNMLVFGEDPDAQGLGNVAKVCDFGLAKPFTHQGVQTPSTITSWYRAPEITLGYPHYDYKVDVWSMGCVLFEMVCRKSFISGVPDKNDDILSAILSTIPEELPMRKFRELIRGNKWRTVVLTKIYPPKGRKTFLQQLGLTNEGMLQFAREAGSMNDFIDLLSSMLCFEWDKRYTITQCLNHPFFNDFRGLINATRTKHPLKVQMDHTLDIRKCVERKWMSSIVIELFNNRSALTWYSHRVMFQAMDLFDRYLFAMFRAGDFPDNAMESEDKGLIHDKYDAVLRFICCIYLCIKYFSTVHYPIAFNKIASPQYHTPEALAIAEQFEGSFIVHCLDYEIYRPTIYEIADKFDHRLDDTNIRDLIMLYGMNDTFNGWTPTEFYQHYIKNVRNKQIDIILDIISKPLIKSY